MKLIILFILGLAISITGKRLLAIIRVKKLVAGNFLVGIIYKNPSSSTKIFPGSYAKFIIQGGKKVKRLPG